MSRVTELEKALTTLFRKGTEVGYTETEIDEFLENIDYTDDHSSESDSVSNQRKLIENFVERNPDIEVVSEKIDDGYSGIIFVEVR